MTGAVIARKFDRVQEKEESKIVLLKTPVAMGGTHINVEILFDPQVLGLTKLIELAESCVLTVMNGMPPPATTPEALEIVILLDRISVKDKVSAVDAPTRLNVAPPSTSSFEFLN